VRLAGFVDGDKLPEVRLQLGVDREAPVLHVDIGFGGGPEEVGTFTLLVHDLGEQAGQLGCELVAQRGRRDGGDAGHFVRHLVHMGQDAEVAVAIRRQLVDDVFFQVHCDAPLALVRGGLEADRVVHRNLVQAGEGVEEQGSIIAPGRDVAEALARPLVDEVVEGIEQVAELVGMLLADAGLELGDIFVAHVVDHLGHFLQGCPACGSRGDGLVVKLADVAAIHLHAVEKGVDAVGFGGDHEGLDAGSHHGTDSSGLACASGAHEQDGWSFECADGHHNASSLAGMWPASWKAAATSTQ